MQELKVTYWGGGVQAKVAQDMLVRFAKTQPSVQIVDVGGGAAVAKLLPLIAAGTPPDWALLNSSTDEVTLAWKGALADLSSYIAKGKIDQGLFWPSAWEMRLVRGKQVGLTTAADIELLFFNKTLFQKAGLQTPVELEHSKTWDWQHFSAAAKALTKRTGGAATQGLFDVYGFELPPILQWQLPFLASWGAWVLSDDLSKPTLETSAMTAAVTALVTLSAKDQSAFPPGIPKAPSFIAMEKAGRVAMAQAWDARTSIWRRTTYDWDVVGSVPQAGHGPQSLLDGTPQALFEGAKNKDMAWNLTAWLLTPRQNLDLNLGYGSVPALRANLAPFKTEMAKKGKPANLSALDEALQAARLIPPTPAYAELESAWDKATAPLWRGQADITSTLASLTTQFTTALNRYQ